LLLIAKRACWCSRAFAVAMAATANPALPISLAAAAAAGVAVFLLRRNDQQTSSESISVGRRAVVAAPAVAGNAGADAVRSGRPRALRKSSSILVRPMASRASGDEVVGISHRGAQHDDEPMSPNSASGTAGLLVHGCHLQADGWEEIVWGHPPARLGRLPQAVLLAHEESAKVVILGTGASQAPDGRLEGQFTLDYIMDRLDRLHDFKALQRFPLPELQTLVRATFRAELESQNTMEEVKAAFRIWTAKGVTRGFLVSSPTHLPRCLACACQAHKEDATLFEGELHASPSETCYEGFEAGDVVVVEPPHRGDRDKALDGLPFHEMVRRSFKVPPSKKVAFLKDFDQLLKKHGV